MELIKSSQFETEKTMSSKEISELTAKRHDNVLVDCRNLNSSYVNLSMPEISVVEKDHPTVKGRKIKEMHLTKMQCFDLMTGYNTELRIKVNRRWEELENKQQHQLPQTFSQALALAAKQAEKIELQEATIEEQKPAVLFAQSVTASKQSILIGELAKILNQNGIDIGQNRLFKWLRENKYINKKNIPNQTSVDMKLFEMVERTISRPDKEPIINITTKVTGKGQVYFVNKFLK